MGSVDTERFEALYRDTYVSLLAYLLRRVSEPADAADVLAEVYLVAWRRLDAIPSGVDGRLWLFGVARRQLANHKRTLSRRDGLTERLAAELPVIVAAVTIDPPDARLTERTRAALSSLSPLDREILMLIAWEELTLPQAAVALGCSLTAARVRLHRARRRFKTALDSVQDPVTSLSRRMEARQ